MTERVRVFAEGDLAGVLVRPCERWQVLARFRGADAEQRARALADRVGALQELVRDLIPPGDVASCTTCGMALTFSSRQRGNGLCGPCTRGM